ncbi:hypothetical protein J6590_098660, partial [Homalodisca vitripennis]
KDESLCHQCLFHRMQSFRFPENVNTQLGFRKQDQIVIKSQSMDSLVLKAVRQKLHVWV